MIRDLIRFGLLVILITFGFMIIIGAAYVSAETKPSYDATTTST